MPFDFFSASNFIQLKKIEEKVLKTRKRPLTSRGQQMLLMKELGCLDKILELNLTKEKTASLLSILFNADHDNLYNDLVHVNELINTLTTEGNYEFLKKTYEEIGLTKLQEKADIKLDELKKLKDSRKAKK